MKRLIFVISVLFFTMLSCSKSKPKGILSEDTMSDMMTEVYAVDGYLNVLPIDSSRKLLPVLYQEIFDRFMIDSTQFNQNVDYYYGDPVQLEKLLTEVQKKLTTHERAAMVKDSISQAHVRDSIIVVQRWERLAREAKDRILHVYVDTTMQYDLVRYSHDFFTSLGLNFERFTPAKPRPTIPPDPSMTEEVPAEEEVPDELQPKETELDSQPLEVLPVEEAIRPIRNRPIPTREVEPE